MLAAKTEHGMRAVFKCKDGFVLKSPNGTEVNDTATYALTCSFGNWTGETPYCQEGNINKILPIKTVTSIVRVFVYAFHCTPFYCISINGLSTLIKMSTTTFEILSFNLSFFSTIYSFCFFVFL